MTDFLQTMRGTAWTKLATLAAVAGLALMTLTPGFGCSVEKCVGGVVLDDGTCEAKCAPDKCRDGNSCVNNRCRLLCEKQADCLPESQVCSPMAEDDTDETVNVCVDQGRQRAITWLGIGTSCVFGDECQAKYCPDNSRCDGSTSTCAPEDCKGALYCLNGVQCDFTSACGGDPTACEQDEAACREAARGMGVEDVDAFLERCNLGLCATTADSCIYNTCAATECREMACISAGNGDAEGYCSLHDCQSDADCGSTYQCGHTRDPHDICGNTCTNVGSNGLGECSHDADVACQVDKHCQKGNNNFCGQTTEPCLEESDFTTDNKTLFETQTCLLRNTCLKRGECAPCENNLDCTLGNTDVCAELGDGNKACARFCADATDCLGDELCTDTDAGKVCLPGSGNCGGASKFCHHCIDDTDCGDKDSTMRCVELSYTAGEYACFDLSYPDTCETDADCPTSPSGAHGKCLDEMAQPPKNPDDDNYHRCFWPMIEEDDKKRYTCWP